MLPFIFFLGINGFFGNVGSVFNGFFGINTDPPPDPPQLVGAYGNIVDLPNSNIVELPPTLPSLQNPIAVSNTQAPFSNIFSMFGNLFAQQTTTTTTTTTNPFGFAINPTPNTNLP